MVLQRQWGWPDGGDGDVAGLRGVGSAVRVHTTKEARGLCGWLPKQGKQAKSPVKIILNMQGRVCVKSIPTGFLLLFFNVSELVVSSNHIDGIFKSVK